MICYSADENPKLSDKHKQNRLDLVQDFIEKPAEYWRNIVFTDEFQLNISKSDVLENIILKS